MKLFPENISTYGHEIDDLFYLIFGFASIAFVISLIALLLPLMVDRKRASYFTGSKWTHLKWVIIPVVLLAISDFVILYVEHGTWAKIEQQLPEKEVHIAVIGRQWNWVFVYPGADNTLYTADDVVVDQQNSELHVPVNKKIVLDLKAKDVLHSASFPVLRFKQDVIPGRTITRWFEATKTGKYEMQCAEICGVLHSKMRNFLVVDSEDDFKKFTAQLYRLDYKTEDSSTTLAEQQMRRYNN